MTFYVYVAGPLSGPPAEYLANVARMSAYARSFMDRGMCSINPAGDLLEGLAGQTPLSDEQYKRRSLDLLRLLEGRRAAVFIVDTAHRDGSVSSGVAAEVEEARRLGIPVAYCTSRLDELRVAS